MFLTPAVGFRRICRAFITVWILALTWAVQAAPVAPSRVHGILVGSIPTTGLIRLSLYWDDNSVGETGFRFRISENGGPQQTFDLGSGPFSTTTGGLKYDISVVPGATYVIDVCSLDGTGPSSYTGQPITITVASFSAPVIQGTYLRSDGSVLMLWSDNSYAETGYLVEMREQSVGNFLPVTPPEVANQDWMILPVMKPGVRYEVRMRAYQGAASSPSAVTAYSNTVLTDVIPGLVAPSNLVVTATNETSVSMTLQDNSANAIGYEVEISYAGMNQFSAFATVADPYIEGSNGVDTLAFPDSVPPGTALDFRVRSFFQETQNGPRTYSPWSATGTVTTPFYAPTNFSATATASPYHINLNWTDTSRVEEAYELQVREVALPGPFLTRKYITGRDLASPYQTSYTDLPGFKPGTTYELRLRSVLGTLETAFTQVVTVTTNPGFDSPLTAQVYVNVPFTLSMTTLSQTSRTSMSASGLPAGVSFYPPGGPLTGTISAPGVYTFPISATFQGGASHQTTMTLRAIHQPAAPRMPVPVPDQTLTLSAPVQVPLQNYFSDPDSESVLRLHTNLGDVDLLFYQTATPQTVANFLNYVNSGRFDGALFHRSEDQFVFQGGGYKVNGSNWFEPIPTFAPVVNEPGLQNVVGTVAMAKQEDQPHSATGQFFFNMNDNQANLDFQNDGFTVFARVGLASYPVLTQMALAPVGDYNVPVQYGPTAEDVFSTPFYNLPLTATPPVGPHSLDLTKLIKITSTEPVPALVYEIVIPPNASVAVASVENGTTLKIEPVSPGVTTIRVSAVDRDGQVTAHTLNLSVTQTFAEWASRQSLSGADALITGDADQDGLSALEEFAFMGDPTKSLVTERPVVGSASTGEGTFLQMTFPVRHQIAGLTYIVEGCNDLVTADWLPVWTSHDTLIAPAVVSVVPNTGFDTVTVRDTVSTTSSSRRFLRIRLVTP